MFATVIVTFFPIFFDFLKCNYYGLGEGNKNIEYVAAGGAEGTHNADSIMESKVIFITSNNVDLESK
jgi:hypothetical protein